MQSFNTLARQRTSIVGETEQRFGNGVFCEVEIVAHDERVGDVAGSFERKFIVSEYPEKPVDVISSDDCSWPVCYDDVANAAF